MISHKQSEGVRETGSEHRSNEDGICNVRHGEMHVPSLSLCSGLIRQAPLEAGAFPGIFNLTRMA